MRILHSLSACTPSVVRTPVVTWGMFDGVHRGHQTILGETIGWAWEEGVPALVLTFARHPALVLRGQEPPFISSLPHRLRLLERAGVDLCVVLGFTRAFSRMTAAEFIGRVVRRRFRARGIVLGEGAQFGRGREGTLDVLRRLGEQNGLRVRSVPPLVLEGSVVSSTRIREAIRVGDLRAATALLGRPVSVFGTVVRGEGRGRKLGVPTANLDPHHEPPLPPGVYGCRVRLADIDFPALTNIGVRPTFTAGTNAAPSIEVHLLPPPGRTDAGVPGHLYGADLEVEFLVRLRDERRFASAAALRAQIEKDRRAFLRQYSPRAVRFIG